MTATIVPALPWYWLHSLYFPSGYDPSGDPQMSGTSDREYNEIEHDHFPVVAWSFYDDRDGAAPIPGGAVGDAWVNDDAIAWAIERPGGSFNAKTGYNFPSFDAWLAYEKLDHHRRRAVAPASGEGMQ